MFVYAVLVGCDHNSSPVEKIRYVTVKDTTDSVEYVSKIVALDYKLYLAGDSINKLKDAVSVEIAKNDSVSAEYRKCQEELIVLKYKVERIKYYNSNIIFILTDFYK